MTSAKKQNLNDEKMLPKLHILYITIKEEAYGGYRKSNADRLGRQEKSKVGEPLGLDKK